MQRRSPAQHAPASSGPQSATETPCWAALDLETTCSPCRVAARSSFFSRFDCQSLMFGRDQEILKAVSLTFSCSVSKLGLLFQREKMSPAAARPAEAKKRSTANADQRHSVMLTSTEHSACLVVPETKRLLLTSTSANARS